MIKQYINTIKLAIQKDGRLTKETLDFLWKSGLDFEVSKQRLFSSCRNFPLEIYFVRDDDIPNYVISKTVDLGIIGQNILYEDRPKVKKLLNLRFGFCSLVVAAPKDSNVRKTEDLIGKKVATSYPNSAKIYFNKKRIKNSIVTISGSVEITPNMGIADAIIDLSSTGSTLAVQDLRIISKIFDSEAVLITNADRKQSSKSIIINKLLLRFRSLLSAKQYKLILCNSPKNTILKLKKYIPCTYLNENNYQNMQIVMKEDIFWESVPKFKQFGIKDIYILPIEKIVT